MELTDTSSNFSTDSVGFQNHPYLYSQYPIDFPSASSHAYSASGVSPQFASNEMYNPNMLGPQAQDFLQQQDASAQQSQQAPLLLNSTHAAERWDGKSKFQKLLEPLIDGFKNVLNPIANIFYGAIPTFRGLNTEVSTDKNAEVDSVEEVKKPREFLVPQPRFIAQRKNFVKTRTIPKKYTELKIDLDRLKRNKDFQDYIKTKKYKHNYPNTYYYPRVKYVLYNPNNFYVKPNNSRLLPYRKTPMSTTPIPADLTTLSSEASEWKPIIVFNHTALQNKTSFYHPTKPYNISNDYNKRIIRRRFRKNTNVKRKKRIKRDISFSQIKQQSGTTEARGFLSLFDFITEFFTSEPVFNMIHQADDLTKSTIKETIIPENKPPFYYSAVYNVLMASIDVLEGIFGVQEDLNKYYFDDDENLVKKKKKIRKASKPKDKLHEHTSNESNSDSESVINIDKTKLTKRKAGNKRKKIKNKKNKIANQNTIKDKVIEVAENATVVIENATEITENSTESTENTLESTENSTESADISIVDNLED